jgi:hypothetical protein
MPPSITSTAVLVVIASASLAVAAAWRRDRRQIYIFKPLTTVLISRSRSRVTSS